MQESWKSPYLNMNKNDDNKNNCLKLSFKYVINALWMYEIINIL